MITSELLRKHKNRLQEAIADVDAHTAISKKGKVYNVKQHTRNYDKALATLSPSGAQRVRRLIAKGAPDHRIKAAIKFQKEMDAKGAKHRASSKARLGAIKKRHEDRYGKGRGSWGAMGRLGLFGKSE